MLAVLKRLVQEVARIPHLEQALLHLTTQVKQAVGVDSCSLYLADYDNQAFVLRATDGLSVNAIGKVSIGFAEGLIGWVGQREEPVNIEDAPKHPRFKVIDEVQEEHYHAFLGTPIIHHRRVLGVLTMQQAKKRKFSEDEEAFLVTLAAQIALEIANADMRGALNFEHSGTAQQRRLNGIAGSPGLAIGKGVTPELATNLRNWSLRRSTEHEQEIGFYRKAVEQTREQVRSLSGELEDAIPDDVRAIFQLYHHLLDANSLGREVEAMIKQGWDAASSLKQVVEDYAARFRAMEDSYMQERAIDIIDLSDRILVNILALVEGTKPSTSTVSEPSILVAEEVSATMLAEFPREFLNGILSIKGSNNSHAAILARAMGVPAVMGVQNVSPSLLNEKLILLDGYSGDVVVSPQGVILEEFEQLVQEEQVLAERIDAEAGKPAQTRDGHAITLLINAGLSAQSEEFLASDAKGIGLYRTEIPFMLRDRFPSESEQIALYKRIFKAQPNAEVTLRTLDVGGDKPLPYFPIIEENPFLGWRGVRMTLDHPEIFLVQVRAMLQASIGLKNLQIMLPMVTSVSEVIEAKRLIGQAFHEVSEEAKLQGNTLYQPRVGIMLEVPSVLYQLPQLAKLVDFFSVGSNDLTQYLLAVDRNNPRVAELFTSYHPAVLSALNSIAKQCRAMGVPVTVCGEFAGEPGGALLLMAMGFTKLSMSAHNLRKIKWVMRNIVLTDAQAVLEHALQADTHLQVLESTNFYLESRGLGGLVRAGN
ncbi:phosphoenolpyruvate-protein phosphotransferase PtsP [Alteromonas sediminis]|uniref:phosphoenolpyruvate--protein phosphotransferase n=1 Tax=Alteromonas sediminis TaxID=2259342 RepID=A0A3N5XY83_9ALTE|nr:phosphoenolpyruvate--protein phosphotransferase [Alteromonas sediminis]RPJ66127.1 phosphoenolpyruvate-protein phosphotransferase PtsP [Alteromonas sediminis]